MKHELAKELKDAGFSQHGEMKGHDVFFNRGDETQEKLYIPILEELIEACHRKDEPSAFVLYSRADTGKWTASSSLGKSNSDDTDGSTPADAVARLWLALNKK